MGISMITRGAALLLCVLLTSGVMAQANDDLAQRTDVLEQQIKQLQAELDQLKSEQGRQKELQEKEALRQALQAKLADTVSLTPNESAHTAGGLSLQQLNPEISVTGDFLFAFKDHGPTAESTDFNFRGLGLHVESWLDPYTRFKAAVPVSEETTVLGEGYIELHQLSDDLVLTLGKFRQQFGRVNRWHKHALDQVDFPMPLRQIFGDGGLNQSGLSVDWLMPPLDQTAQKLTLQVTDGDNDRVFGGNDDHLPSVLARYSLYADWNKDTYGEAGLSGLLGWNDTWSMQVGSDREDRRTATVLGADFTVRWEPTNRMRYRNVEWRSEAYWLQKGLQAPDGSGSDTIHAWGCFSYVQAKVSRTVDLGLRGDLYFPDTKGYANLSDDLSLSPLAVTTDDAYLYQLCPYVTWWQSPFVKFRAEYNYNDGRGLDVDRHAVWLQVVFAAGPHKHERY